MAVDKNGAINPEWSVPAEAEPLGVEVLSMSITADEGARGAVARRLGVEGVTALEAALKFSRTNGHIIHIEGRVKAEVLQSCVVTLAPIVSHIDEPFEAWYADPQEAVSFVKRRKQKELQDENGEVPILDEKDDPEHVVDGLIDLGELAVQFLSLAVDPYPHAEGAVHEITDDAVRDDKKTDVKENPFAALKGWKFGQGDPE